MNRFTQCRNMNEARFFWFFFYLIDLRNNAKEKKLRFLLDPRSHERKDYCTSLRKILLSKGKEKEVAPVMPEHPYTEHSNNTYSCNYCGKIYKQLSSLKAHLQKNRKIVDVISYICKKCSKVFQTKYKLTRHQKTC